MSEPRQQAESSNAPEPAESSKTKRSSIEDLHNSDQWRKIDGHAVHTGMAQGSVLMLARERGIPATNLKLHRWTRDDQISLDAPLMSAQLRMYVTEDLKCFYMKKGVNWEFDKQLKHVFDTALERVEEPIDFLGLGFDRKSAVIPKLLKIVEESKFMGVEGKIDLRMKRMQSLDMQNRNMLKVIEHAFEVIPNKAITGVYIFSEFRSRNHQVPDMDIVFSFDAKTQ
ncbi:MAG: hypothetical protein M1831_005772 [Alyxoria varia]|nr:MAG: hypothetical protein M1831_005772 [Alyxoria varia]